MYTSILNHASLSKSVIYIMHKRACTLKSIFRQVSVSEITRVIRVSIKKPNMFAIVTE